ncbi:hypothetical protein AA0115_g13022 [Alternaria tenuissima]|uniref:Heterokaryon incompatibility domain-containing protein n=1 Tax=Alternaria tenuissima TaxID=119927 RepID=A0AB37VXJ4_9PLEO|nr:hypothetical protein AA0115_g13022 [Alternaria tenuissima]
MEELRWGPIVEAYFDPVRRARELLEACDPGDDDAHFRCQPEKMDTSTRVASLPRRLLALSALNYILTLDVQECICTGRATVDELSNYCTLSYRWGDKRLDCMLSTQFDGHRVLRYADLPQTFKDAIVVARGLKIRYLWIDALCIIQPSAHGDYTDWNAEGPRMWLIYQNAVCTIAATCSDKPNDGFLHKTGTDRIASCSIFGKTEYGTELPLSFWSSSPTFYDSVVASRLNRRGWVAQERLLSRRMLHFTEEGVFWECQALDATDRGRTPSA